ncbi:MAG: DUF4197 domain-containing protein [Flavobacteriales bacterium]|nr:DUF4197 domain-containing protein [Flavobacteriales bacterium]
MMKKSHIMAALFCGLALQACSQKLLKDLEKTAGGDLGDILKTEKPLTEDEVARGLREALEVGTNNSSGKASAIDGFNKNPLIHIPFPPEAEKMEEKLRAIGMGKQVDEFTLTLNRAAEEAAKKSAPIFIDAIKKMTITDAMGILKGSNNQATSYLQEKTTSQLHDTFKPVVHDATESVNLTKYWSPLIQAYNKIPMVEKMNPDLDEYVTQQAMDGLFKLIAQEEEKIRTNPAAQVTDLLKRVFGKKS